MMNFFVDVSAAFGGIKHLGAADLPKAGKAEKSRVLRKNSFIGGDEGFKKS
jgi:hypothetical protein